MTISAMTQFTTTPLRTNPLTFSSDMDTRNSELVTFNSELNQVIALCDSAITAGSNSAAAIAAANYKGAWSSLTGAATIPYCVSHLGFYWQLSSNLADVTTKTPGTDPEWLIIDFRDERVYVMGDLGGGTDTIDLGYGTTVTATVSTSEQTFVFSNPSATGHNCSFTFILTNGGSQTVNWPVSVDWVGGTAPSLTVSGKDVLVFSTLDGGTTWYGFVAGKDIK